MFTPDDLYKIVSAEKHELEWDTQDDLEHAYDIYSNLSEKDQKKFKKLVKQALVKCKDEFDSFPESYQHELDLEIRDDLIATITEKLETIFVDFIQ